MGGTEGPCDRVSTEDLKGHMTHTHIQRGPLRVRSFFVSIKVFFCLWQMITCVYILMGGGGGSNYVTKSDEVFLPLLSNFELGELFLIIIACECCIICYVPIAYTNYYNELLSDVLCDYLCK